ncbi:MAG: hypothetical protein EHM77_01610, partial [Planctomycetaceae bacterium]
MHVRGGEAESLLDDFQVVAKVGRGEPGQCTYADLVAGYRAAAVPTGRTESLEEPEVGLSQEIDLVDQ